MEKPIKIDDLGYPYFWKHPYTKSCTLLVLQPQLRRKNWFEHPKWCRILSSHTNNFSVHQAQRIRLCEFSRLSTSQISLRKVFEWGIPRYFLGNPAWVS